MSQSFFREGVLRRAWQTAWSNKSLWFFGLFAAILAVGEEYDLLVRNSDILDGIPARLEQLKSLSTQGITSGFWNDLVQTLRTNLPASLGLILTIILVILAIAWLIIVAQGALIEGAKRREQKKSFSILEGFDQGMANFWPMFILNAIMKIVVYGALYIVVIPLAIAYVKQPSQTIVLWTMLWSFVILVPLVTIISFVTKYASAFIVVKKYPVRQAISAGWSMFIEHWLVSLEMAFILIFINLAVILPTTYTLFGLFNFPYTSNAGYVVIILAFALVYSILATFQFAAWTNLFFRLQEGEAPSKLKRVVNYFLGIDVPDRPSRPAGARR